MVSDQIVNDTIKRMLDAGIDEATIVATLADIGLDEAAARQRIEAVKGGGEAAPAAPEPSPEMNAMQAQIETTSDAIDMHQAATATALDLHEQKLNEMGQQVQEVRDAVAASPSAGPDSSLSYRLSALEAKLAETNAAVNATLDVMKKVLETDRKILVDMESKK
jgi:hypothetical protein